MGAIVGFLRAGFGGGNGSDFEGVCHHTWGCLWGMLPVDIGGGEFVGWPLRVSGGASGAFLCPPPPVLVHMSMGFMMLALALCIVLLFTMGLSFWPFLRRLIKVDLVFSFLSFSIGKCQLGGGCALPSPASFPWAGVSFRLSGGVSQSFCPAIRWVCLWKSLGISFPPCASLVLLFLSFLVGLSSRCVCVFLSWTVREDVLSLFSFWGSWGPCPVSCPSLAPPECRAPDCPQPDALCSQLRDTKTEATSILPRDRLPVLGLQRLDAVGR